MQTDHTGHCPRGLQGYNIIDIFIFALTDYRLALALARVRVSGRHGEGAGDPEHVLQHAAHPRLGRALDPAPAPAPPRALGEEAEQLVSSNLVISLALLLLPLHCSTFRLDTIKIVYLLLEF